MTFELRNVSYAYPRSRRPALRRVSLEIEGAQHTAVLGPNGAGKTTLVRLLLGLVRPDDGVVLYEGRPAAVWGRREIARRIGVVSQDGPPNHPVTVREFVDMGRHPYVRPWARLREEDREAVRSAIRRVDLEELEERPVNGLSGGEVQRAKLARAFAQGPEVLVLDEPTAHLDIGHEMQLFSLVRDFVDEGGSAVTITHNLHLASRFADRLLLLDEGRLLASGPPDEVLRDSVLSRVFRWPIRVVDLDAAGLSGLQVVPVDLGRDRDPGASFDNDRAEEGSP